MDAVEVAGPCTCGSRTTSWMRKWKVRKHSSPAAREAAKRRRTAPRRRRAAGRVAGSWRRSSTALAAPYAASPEGVQSARKASTSLSSPAVAAIGLVWRSRVGKMVGWFEESARWEEGDGECQSEVDRKWQGGDLL